MSEDELQDRAPEWWAKFVLEMQAIGCVNLRHERGEFCFDCLPERLSEAKKIVARYSVK